VPVIIKHKITISQIYCNTVVSASKIPGLDYTVNPYLGCWHGCVYCYARYMTKFSKSKCQWGEFVDVKINAPEMLKRELFGLKKGLVSLSTVTDPYQAPERKYRLTRRILEELAAYNFSVSILTKSNLILRDIDILKKFERNNLEVGFSITTLDEEVRRHFEPNAPSIKDRINALKQLSEQGIKTWVFIAPILPYISENTIRDLLNEIRHSADYIMLDRLNIKSGNWYGIVKVLKKNYPFLYEKWKEILFSKDNKRRYYHDLYSRIAGYCEEKNIFIHM
jgi:DNA repair photolyase